MTKRNSKGRRGKRATRGSAKRKRIAKTATTVRRKFAAKKKRSPGKKKIASRTAVPRALVGALTETRTITIESFPKGGMTMKVNGVKLTRNPQALQLMLGEHLLEWTFVGPSEAEFAIHVTGAREPQRPITDKIAPGEHLAAGSYDVLV